MKIAVLTLPLHVNYGGNIQNFALQRFLKSLGHDVVTVHCKTYNETILKLALSAVKRTLLKPKSQRNYIFTNSEKKAISINHDEFIYKYIERTEELDYSSFKTYFEINKYDAIFVGSDQVWRPKYAPHLSSYFLGFLDIDSKTKKISYAASFGSDEWEYSPEQEYECKNLAKRFDAISVRESLAVDMCNEHFDVAAQHVLDPTMLLTKDDYIELFKDKNLPNNNGKIFNYTLDMDDDKVKLVDKISKKINRDIFSTYPNKTKKKTIFVKNIVDYQYPSVEAWLKSFADAEFIVTDSFHGTVFSILFNKPFIALCNKERGAARFTSLLKMFNLESRLVTDCNDVDDDTLFSAIDYEHVNERLSQLRVQSFKFIERALGTE
ncbi:polysaccharide pyruvyl transferase family protein [Raoultella terrigena]|uniref:polysaccharide pyruvyl transferase family protein n=1 Tax=Raoultella terrigena TaxID=577 RepID=UPI001F525E4A|nr:polysaccharide pyruvyl transferase family protein [Raoultella terrigena]MCI1030797.1 polysaccharide pyruvyl transferase family protein [Raoultella terrigena]